MKFLIVLMLFMSGCCFVEYPFQLGKIKDCIEAGMVCEETGVKSFDENMVECNEE